MKGIHARPLRCQNVIHSTSTQTHSQHGRTHKAWAYELRSSPGFTLVCIQCLSASAFQSLCPLQREQRRAVPWTSYIPLFELTLGVKLGVRRISRHIMWKEKGSCATTHQRLNDYRLLSAKKEIDRALIVTNVNFAQTCNPLDKVLLLMLGMMAAGWTTCTRTHFFGPAIKQRTLFPVRWQIRTFAFKNYYLTKY